MAKRFLTRDLIVSIAFRMIDEGGTESFSVRKLASKLGVQVSSLYNHIDNEYDLLLEVAKLAADMYAETIELEIDGLTLDESLYKGGDVFRTFVNEHKYLYELLLDRRWIGDPEFDKVNETFTMPITNYLNQFNITDQAARDHIYVALRVVSHGFGSLDSNGIFDGLSVDTTESYHLMMKSVIELIKSISKEQRNDP